MHSPVWPTIFFKKNTKSTVESCKISDVHVDRTQSTCGPQWWLLLQQDNFGLDFVIFVIYRYVAEAYT